MFWHGMFVDGTSWDRLIPLLGDDRDVIVLDGPGLGLSEPLRRTSSIDEAATVARELLDGLGVARPVDFVGNA